MKVFPSDNVRLESLSQAMAYRNYCLSHNDNRAEIEKMKRHLYKALELELTDKQRYCITQYYLKGRKMKDIAEDLQVNPSVVSRHISRGINKIKKTLPYSNK